MKYFVILIVPLLFSGYRQQKDFILEGRYKIEFEKEFHSQNSTITIDDTIYSRTFLDGTKVSGIVKYWKYFVVLRDNNSSQIIEFKREEIKNDIFTVGLKETDPNKSETASYLEGNITLGKFTKIE